MQIFDQNLAYVATLSEETSSLEVVTNDSVTEANLMLAPGCAGTAGTFGTLGGSFGTFGSYGSYGG